MWRRLLLAPIVLYVTWLGFLGTHELGHVLHARLVGARVLGVSIPLFGFSQTFVDANRHELAVVIGGPLWGTLIPLMLLALIATIARRRSPLVELPKFFAGFCCLANGAYVGAGAFVRTGDAGDMLRLGVPASVMLIAGASAFAVGLWLWHRASFLSARPRAAQRSEPVAI